MKVILGLSSILMMAGAVAGETQNPNIEREIVEFRARIREAVKTKDRKNLEQFLAEGFTHTHASGKVDGKTGFVY